MKSQTNNHSTIKKPKGVLVLTFIFILIASFQAKAQHTVTFGNKSHCE